MTEKDAVAPTAPVKSTGWEVMVSAGATIIFTALESEAPTEEPPAPALHKVTVTNPLASSPDVVMNVRYVDFSGESPVPVDIQSGDQVADGESIFVQLLNSSDKKLKLKALIGGAVVDEAEIDRMESGAEEPAVGGLFGIALTGDLEIVLEEIAE